MPICCKAGAKLRKEGGRFGTTCELVEASVFIGAIMGLPKTRFFSIPERREMDLHNAATGTEPIGETARMDMSA